MHQADPVEQAIRLAHIVFGVFAKPAAQKTDIAKSPRQDVLHNRQSLNQLADFEGVIDVQWNGGIHATLKDLDRLPDLIAGLVDGGARLTRVEPLVPTLEELYFEMQRSHMEQDA